MVDARLDALVAEAAQARVEFGAAWEARVDALDRARSAQERLSAAEATLHAYTESLVSDEESYLKEETERA